MATSRDDVVALLHSEIEKVGVANTVERGYKIAVLAGIAKRIYTGTSKYKIIEWLNKEHRRVGNGMKYLVTEAYEVIKDVEF
jgi:hypothetical protein